MIDPDSVDLDLLTMALEDNSGESSWWVDPRSGEVEFCGPDDDADSFKQRGLVSVDPLGSRAAYADMSEFVDRIRSQRAQELLRKAIQGRGAFRRFQDRLSDFPELRTEWHVFHDRWMRRHAIEWLVETDLVAIEAADAAIAELGSGEIDVSSADIAPHAAEGLRELYGDRLSDVVLFGSYARREADSDSDIDLLVVLRGSVNPWEELRRLDDVLWQLSFEHGVTISALPVSEEQWRTGGAPVLVEARAHGVVLT
jgi:predicted nucleotidyltransferase